MTFWYWLALSGLFFILEIFSFTLIFLFLGLASLSMSIITFFTPDISILSQSVTSSILTLVALFSFYSIYKKKKNEAPTEIDVNDRMATFIGKVVKITSASYNGIAKAKIGDTQWRVIINDANVGDMVKIIGSKSTNIIAEKTYK